MQNRASNPTQQWLLVIPILFIVFALAFSRMLSDALWLDEIWTHGYSGSGGLESKSLLGTVLDIMINNPSWPPLYYVTQNIWGQLTGNSLLTEHLLPTFFGLLSVALSYRFGKELLGNLGGLFTALLVGTSGIFIYYMHETRAYTMYVFLSLLVGWMYWLILTRKNYKRRWLRWGFPISIAIALYTHYGSGLFIASILVYHLLFELGETDEAQKRWLDIIKLWFNGCLTFSIWLGILIAHLSTKHGNDWSESLITVTYSALVTFTNNTWIGALVILLLSLAFIQRRAIRFLWVWFASSTIMFAIVAGFLFHPRHFLPLLAIIALLMSATLVEIYKRTKIIAVALIIIWVGAGIYYAFQDDFLAIVPKEYETIPISLVNTTQAFTEGCLVTGDTVIFNILPYEIEYQYEMSFHHYYFREQIIDYNIGYLGTLVTDYQYFSTLSPEVISLPYSERIETVTAGSEQVWIYSRNTLHSTEEFTFARDALVDSGYTSCGSIAVSDNLQADLFTQGNSCEMVLNTCNFAP